jgi:hypothetical protein
MCNGASLTDNYRIGEQLEKTREVVYAVHIQGTMCHQAGTLLPVQ